MGKPVVNLIGRDGNAFAVIGECHRAAKAAKWSTEQWNKVRNEMMAGDYDHLLQTAVTFFEVARPDISDECDDEDCEGCEGCEEYHDGDEDCCEECGDEGCCGECLDDEEEDE